MIQNFRRNADYLLSGVLTIIITLLLLMPMTPGPPPPVPGLDKIIHAVLFFVIALPILMARPHVWVWVVPVVIGYGGFIELVQPFFGRGRELGDFFANALGILLAVPVGRWFNRRLSDRRQAHQHEGPERHD